MIRKEFQQIFRNRQMAPIIFVMPLIQLLILVNAATFEIRNIHFAVIDDDNTSTSRELVRKYSHTNYYKLHSYVHSDREATRLIEHNKIRLLIKIPKDFEKNFYTNTPSKVEYIINAEDGSAAGVIQSYSLKILQEYSPAARAVFPRQQKQTLPQIVLNDLYWYNPHLNYKEFMIPGILGILVTIIGFFLSSINIVREKEIGTIEQLNVTPIMKYQFVIGKLLPFWIIALFELAFGLLLAKLLYDFTILGNIFLIFSLSSVYLVVILAGGLLISTISQTQQQAMFITFFFNLLIILLSGLFTPIESMPGWAQVLSFFDPFSHMIEILRRVMIKGAGFADVQKQAAILSFYALGMVALAVLRYRKSAS